MNSNESLLNSLSTKGYILLSEIQDLQITKEEVNNYCKEKEIPFLESLSVDEVVVSDKEPLKQAVGTRLAKELVSFKPFTSEQEKIVRKIIADGQNAQKLIDQGKGNETLEKMVSEAKKAQDKLILSLGHYYIKLVAPYIGKGVSYDDLLMSAIEGAQKALKKFDFTMGIRFSTYATWWIIQTVQNEVASFQQGRAVPVSRLQAYNKVFACRCRFEKDNGRAPTDEELCDTYGITPAQIKIANEMYHSNIVSLDSLVTVEEKEDKIPLSEIIQNDSKDILEDKLKDDALRTLMCAMEKRLNDKEIFVIQHTYGIGGNEIWNAEQIANALGLTVIRIRQIDKSAQAKLQKDAVLREALIAWVESRNE